MTGAYVAYACIYRDKKLLMHSCTASAWLLDPWQPVGNSLTRSWSFLFLIIHWACTWQNYLKIV